MASDPLRAHVISYLSREMSPSGESAGVAFAQLARDGAIHIIAHEGFIDFDPTELPQLTIDSRKAASLALRTGRLTLFTETELLDYQGDLPANLKGYWKSAAALPIGLHAVYFINFRDDVTIYREFDDFLHCIASILTSFEWEQQEKSGKKSDPWFDEESYSLSMREERILDLIRERKTNFEIAQELGYSESLIRQETVAIYRKLGVTGRKEIMNEESTPKRARKKAIRAAIALAGIETFRPLFQSLESLSNNVF